MNSTHSKITKEEFFELIKMHDDLWKYVKQYRK